VSSHYKSFFVLRSRSRNIPKTETGGLKSHGIA
jgi:hypothetical protein